MKVPVGRLLSVFSGTTWIAKAYPLERGNQRVSEKCGGGRSMRLAKDAVLSLTPKPCVGSIDKPGTVKLAYESIVNKTLDTYLFQPRIPCSQEPLYGSHTFDPRGRLA